MERSTPSRKRRLRSQDWFGNEEHIDLAALYMERFMNYGVTPEELQAGKPIIGIAQSGSDLTPCNRVHIELAKRVRDGIRDAGGIPIEFPTHPIFENCKRPTAALDRNLAYLGLVEILYGYPIDGVVLTTGCDKTTPSAIMAAATVNIPAIVLSGGPMLDGWHNGKRVGSGTLIWQSRRKLATGEMSKSEFMELALDSASSVGHCNTMGTASTMNALAEALGLTLTGSATIPAAYKERGQMAYRTGRRAVELVNEDLKPLDILTRASFLNAIRVTSALGGSTNAQPHLMAMARHAGIEITADDWKEYGYHVPLLANVQPAGEYLSESFHRAGGVAAVMWELWQNNMLDAQCLTVSGQPLSHTLKGRETTDRNVIYPFHSPLRKNAGFQIFRGNLFDFAIMKTSVISEQFTRSYLSAPGHEGIFEARAIVFEGSEDYHQRIDDPELSIDEHCILVIRGAGPLGWPGAAEVVNMQPPAALMKKGITSLPTLGDGRQSGTADSPSILHASPESAAGGGLVWLRTGDMIRIDINAGTCDALVPEDEIAQRRAQGLPATPKSQTPWQKIFRKEVNQLSDGAVLESAVDFIDIASTLPRHNH